MLALILKGCIAGERAAQTQLYHLYARKMMGVCLWYARNNQEAEEILQDGFLRVFKYIHTYSGIGSLEGWIRKIMINAALLRYKNKSTQLKPLVEYSPDQHDFEEYISIISELDAKDLLNLVQQLSPAYRIVFNLHALEGLKHREIAQLLDISEGTSKSNLSDAKTILQKLVIAQRKAESV